MKAVFSFISNYLSDLKMRIFLHGKRFYNDKIELISGVFKKLNNEGFDVCVSDVFAETFSPSFPDLRIINLQDGLDSSVDIIMTLGGDGTILDVAPQASSIGIPVIGINLGRLGFLADIKQADVGVAIERLGRREYTIDKRSMMKLSSAKELFNGRPYALNEVAVHKRDSSSMITIHASIDGNYLNTYWGDGLIISTPTGSTAYSLSVGGPILAPGCNNVVIAPIAPHNLNVRPLVVPDKLSIQLVPDAREASYLVSLDGRNEVLDEPLELTIERSPNDLQLIQLPNQEFMSTLREKLMWGKDLRTSDKPKSEQK
jgi:NAD+ kinase